MSLSSLRPTRRVVIWTTASLGALLLVTAVWAAIRVSHAIYSLQEAKAVAGAMARDIRNGAVPVPEDVVAAQVASGRADAAMHDPVVTFYSWMPGVGPQVRAVRDVAEAMNTVTTQTLPPMVDLAVLLAGGSLQAPGGGFDLTVLEAAGPSLAAADEAAAAAQTQVSSIRTGPLVGDLAVAVVEADTTFTGLADSVSQLRRAVDLLPGLLGSEAERTYLVLAVNNAELRPQGGIVGSLIEVTADDGHIEIGQQLASSALTDLDEPVVALSAEEMAVDGERLGLYVQNASLALDFPRMAQLASARWVLETGEPAPDLVLAVDTVAVARLIKAMEVVNLPDGTTLDNRSFLTQVLKDPYLRNGDPQAADAQFAVVAAAVLGSLTSGEVESGALLKAMRDVVVDQRVHLWSADAEEQAALSDSMLAGRFLSGADSTVPGVFLTDITGGKLDYYLTTKTTSQCTAVGTVVVQIEMSYSPPALVTSGGTHLSGLASDSWNMGDMAVLLSAYPGAGDRIGEIKVNGTVVGGPQVVQDGRTGIRVPIVLTPGSSALVTVEYPMDEVVSAVRMTPTMTDGGTVRVACVAEEQ